jgi:hypothetical protein
MQQDDDDDENDDIIGSKRNVRKSRNSASPFFERDLPSDESDMEGDACDSDFMDEDDEKVDAIINVKEQKLKPYGGRRLSVPLMKYVSKSISSCCCCCTALHHHVNLLG